ncbi:MAG: hypothetical protein A2268_05160 [Candidatus Raymondbacteria bacterium RifOxyA12_full_50_37]|uniref:Uncharacterized protein n=1 Tax=Candidatus Raymondbacteria bacterium RIFOXYD12_FULL_49_13 TaxID=1817890 RepID=A0A1F7FDL4_UNCRA|nr:MAG: hypothetical protein A2248_10100 [Candidatus Raymondbacteria bacterium RIFOXYA2_FULL_49_16]OGJ88154.1 MAG: hypothetical protein A2268_05160 [Candidatus Raymondbacteria bacterium RifOxyA12_full_50_37]OGJ93635.1 MAG: hypothetical protein A2350_06595 [Candidatus Raymondbacteria bacterium RifOxyB12_full_50_8]OGJ96956.1 MAG: hypothetical protein A2453_04965 [Candidatus Raymondbacteria bacterium RIFOXYC2_FULL_50_21]OGK04681.1 MAG: hypothetical protein A2519_21135 [Candidatus Raymondbacteria b
MQSPKPRRHHFDQSDSAENDPQGKMPPILRYPVGSSPVSQIMNNTQQTAQVKPAIGQDLLRQLRECMFTRRVQAQISLNSLCPVLLFPRETMEAFTFIGAVFPAPAKPAIRAVWA